MDDFSHLHVGRHFFNATLFSFNFIKNFVLTKIPLVHAGGHFKGVFWNYIFIWYLTLPDVLCLEIMFHILIEIKKKHLFWISVFLFYRIYYATRWAPLWTCCMTFYIFFFLMFTFGGCSWYGYLIFFLPRQQQLIFLHFKISHVGRHFLNRILFRFYISKNLKNIYFLPIVSTFVLQSMMWAPLYSYFIF